MIVRDVEGRDYKVYWRYSTTCSAVTHEDVQQTSAYLTCDEHEGDAGCASVVRNVHDPQHRNTGRKRALAKLLAQEWPCHPQIRKRFWDAYRAQLGHW